MKIYNTLLKLPILLSTAIFSMIMPSCNDDDNVVQTPVITSFTPASGLPGATVNISGNNFSSTLANNQVSFNGIVAPVTSATATELVVTVPETASTGKITITANGKTGTSSTDFTLLQTTITGFSPESGTHGTTVTITGTNFSETLADNSVKFNGVAASLTAATSSQLTVSVPAEATTGKITVTILGKVTTSATNFTVPAPTITNYFPAIAAPGISITITGTNFSSVTSNNIVKFNGVNATVTAASPTQLTVTVPVGATTGLLTVKVGLNTATSSSNFAICNGPELVISEVEISNTSGATSYTVTFKITNVGGANVDLNKMNVQNYASIDDAMGNDAAAGGSSLLPSPTLSPGQSSVTSFFSNIVGGNTTSHPYLIITLYDFPDGSVMECNTDNNIMIKPFQP